MNNISNQNSYIKKISVDLMSYESHFKEVETKFLRKLNFYERAIVMLLSKGVSADTIDELKSKISSFLNIRESFVAEFIDLLQSIESLYDGGNKFSLSPSAKFKKDAKDERVLWSNVQRGKDDFAFLYVSQLDVITKTNVPGLKVFNDEPIEITENYISPLAKLIVPHLKKLESIAQDVMPNDLAMVFDQNVLLEQLTQNVSYGKKSIFQVDAEYVFDDAKQQGKINSIVELIGLPLDDEWEYLRTALQNYVTNNYVIDYEVPLFKKAEGLIEKVDYSQRVLINHKKDYMANEKAINKLDEKISTLEEEIKTCQDEIKKIEKNLKGLTASADVAALNKEKSNLNKKNNELSKKISAKEKLLEDKKQIETENIIINHKIEDASVQVVSSFKIPDFSSSNNYFKKITELYKKIMKLPFIKLRTSIDNMVKAVLLLLYQIEDRCEEGIKNSLKTIKAFVDIINLIYQYVYKVENLDALNLIYDASNKGKNFDKFKKVCPDYSLEIQQNLAKLLPLFSTTKSKTDKEKPWLESVKKDANKDFFENSIKNKTYRKDIVFSLIEFLLCLNFKESDWAIIEEKLK